MLLLVLLQNTFLDELVVLIHGVCFDHLLAESWLGLRLLCQPLHICLQLVLLLVGGLLHLLLCSFLLEVTLLIEVLLYFLPIA